MVDEVSEWQQPHHDWSRLVDKLILYAAKSAPLCRAS